MDSQSTKTTATSAATTTTRTTMLLAMTTMSQLKCQTKGDAMWQWYIVDKNKVREKY